MIGCENRGLYKVRPGAIFDVTCAVSKIGTGNTNLNYSKEFTPVNEVRCERSYYKDELSEKLETANMEINGLQVELEFQSIELERYRSEIRGLNSTQTKYKELFDSAPIGYLIVDSFQQIKEINPAGAALFGKRSHQISNTPFPLYVDPGDRELLRMKVDRVCSGADERMHIKIVSNSGRQIPVALFLHPVRDQEQRGVSCQITMMDISEHRETEEQLRNARDYLRRVAMHDSLTGLPNRRSFNDTLEKSLIYARRSGERVAVLMLDLDQFKYVNDTLGHEAGDRLLCETALRIQKSVREHDVVARLGGDEFTVIIKDFDHVNMVETICETIRRSLAEPYIINEHEVCTAASIGVCVYPTDSVHNRELVKFADAAMYRAKASGRNCVRFFTPDLSMELSRRFKLESDLRSGIRKENFDVWYQPICAVDTGEVVGIEALTRWRHPERGLISPSEFITVAEECGAIEPLGYYILDKACRQLVQLQSQGHETLTLAVNISPRQFALPGFVEQVREILRLTGLDAAFLELEVTESVVFHDDRRSMGVMEELRDLGVSFAIDDFGTGYSSFARLRRLPISKIKIDQSFTRGIPHDSDDCSIARAIISMAHDLGVNVVSEGVESLNQLEYLRKIGCQMIQGYLIGEPMPEHILPGVLKSNDAKMLCMTSEEGGIALAPQALENRPKLKVV
jgi:diguanylate cyclase (GGDEF)-like protein/PAS domain S-box-containing protein